ncbi:phage tail tape measure protein (plasmid) [Brevibacillus laterosporus]|uniref:Phage tail tape measure protein n=1 Tax=Brevibacillus laterosporus TaxID=1465 RepID=A0A502J6W5_BRELA|nr:phage tail tape measure protein [Brevibacillus laterosporus]TPG88472.1 phage tail tape measure protein [Brevibacillus laterosporus]TPG93562.1 phage tail tape measure protein [Brevibacillus laterosporus]
MDRATQETQKKMEYFKNLGWVGASIGAAGAAGLYALQKLADKAGDVQMQLIQLGGVYGLNLDDSQLVDLEKKAQDLSQQTLFSQKEVLGIDLELAHAGISKDVLNDVLKESTYLAEIEVGMGKSGSAERSAYNFARMAEDAGITNDLKRMQEFADTMNRVINVTHASSESLGESFKYSMPVVKHLGWTEQDNLLATAMAARAGVEGSMAGTHIKDFAERVNPFKYLNTKGGQKQLAAMAEAGLLEGIKEVTSKGGAKKIVGFDNAALLEDKNHIKSYAEMIDILHNKYEVFKKKSSNSTKFISQTSADDLKKIQESAKSMTGKAFSGGDLEWAAMMNHIFGEQGQDFAIISSHTEMFQKLKGQMEQQKHLHDQIDTIRQSFVGQKHVASGQLETIGLQIGKPIMEMVIPAFNVLTETLAKVIKYLDDNPAVTKFMTTMAMGTSIFLILSGAVLVTVSAFKGMQLALQMMGIGFRSILFWGGGITLAIGAIAGAAYLIYENWDTLKPYAEAVWKGIKESISPVVDWLKVNVVPVFKAVGDSLEEQFKRIEGWISTNKGKIESFLGFTRKSEKVGNDPEGKETLSWKPPGWLKTAGGIGALFIGGKALDKTVSTLSKLRGVMSAVGRIGGPVKFFAAWVQGKVELKLFGGLLTKTFGLLKKIPGVSGITRIGTAFFAVGKRMIGIFPIITRFGGLFARIMGSNAKLIGIGLLQIAKLGGSFTWLAARALWMGGRFALAWIIGLGPVAWIIAGVTALVVAGIVAWNTNFLGFRDKMTALWQYIKEKASAVWDWLSSLPSEAVQWGENLMKMLAQGITNGIAWVQKSVEDVSETVKNFIGWSSPTKKGPASKSDKWAPNLMKMLSSGITDYLPHLESAAGSVADTLRRNLNGSIEVQPNLNSRISQNKSSGYSDKTQLPDLHFNIYQQPGEDSEALVKRIKREVMNELGRSTQRANMTMGRGAFGGIN